MAFCAKAKKNIPLFGIMDAQLLLIQNVIAVNYTVGIGGKFMGDERQRLYRLSFVKKRNEMMVKDTL